jgi:putative effector of murein hydrolase
MLIFVVYIFKTCFRKEYIITPLTVGAFVSFVKKFLESKVEIHFMNSVLITWQIFIAS